MTTVAFIPHWVIVMAGIAATLSVLDFILKVIGSYLKFRIEKRKAKAAMDDIKSQLIKAFEEEMLKGKKQPSQNEPPSDLLRRQTQQN